jgi:hypothetical protein
MPIPVFSYRGGPKPDELEQLARAYPRIAITGGPNSGKSRLAALLQPFRDGAPMICTDTWKDTVPFLDVPDVALAECRGHERFTVEGVQVARMLRKGLDVDLVIFLRGAAVELTSRQRGLTKGVRTVLDDWLSTGAGVPTLKDPENEP